jgi:outer membrane protein assembly factor BamB
MRLFLLLLFCLVLAGCAAFDTLGEAASGISDYFLGGEDNSDPPAVLVEYAPEIKIEEIWQESVGVGSDERTLKLVPAVGSGKIIAADNEGLVEARDVRTGKLLWEAETEIHLSGGPGLGRGTVILGSSDAQVVALNSETGETLWTSEVSSEVLSVPVIANGIAIIRTTDGVVFAFNEKNGAKLWSYEINEPALSVRGIGAPIIVEDKVIVGYDNGKLMALRLTDGKYGWETSIAIPKGRSEVERLADLDADPIDVAGVIYIAGYHGGIAAVSESDGEVLWRNESISSYAGLSHDSRYLYLTNASSDVLQLDQRTGASLWKQKDLHQRKLTAPSVYDSYVVVGDFEGYVHWLSTVDGRQLGRIKAADSGIDAKPVVVDNTVYIYAKDGTLAAYKIQ